MVTEEPGRAVVAVSQLVEAFGLKGEQRAAAVARGADVVVTAGAGSGKTRTLVARYVSLLDEGWQPRQVVAVTFTEKAAREMRNRIRKAIGEWRAGGCAEGEQARWEGIEADIDAASIGTIHSLCAGLLRTYPAEAGIDPLAAVLDEGETAALRAQVVEDTLNWASGVDELRSLFAVFEGHELRDVLARLLGARLESRAALEHTDVARRWRWAVGEMLGRFARGDGVAGAIAGLRELRDTGRLVADGGEKLAEQSHALLARWEALEEALEAGDGLAAARALRVVRRDHSSLRVGLKNSLAKELTGVLRERYKLEVEPWLGQGDDPDPDGEIEGRAAELVGLLKTLFEEADRAYRRAKDLRQAVDFDDLEWGAMKLLDSQEVRARWQRQLGALLVDEFQDTNQRQRRIVEALAGIPEGVNGRLFVVGDAKQSIYRFRGADVSVFRRVGRDIRARGGRAIALGVTYRAHKSLVEALNVLLGRAMGERDDPERPHAVPFSALTADRAPAREGIGAPYVELLYGLGGDADTARAAAAAMLARRLGELHAQEGVEWKDIALLFRAAGGFPPYEAALEEAGIPFVTVAGKGFYERPEVRDILNILRALADPWDDLAMAGLLRSPAFGLSDAGLYQLRWPADAAKPASFLAALHGNLDALSEGDRRQAERARKIVEQLAGKVDRVTVADLIKELLDRTRYAAILAAARQGPRLRRNVDKLLADAESSGIVRVAEFLEYIETLRVSGAREGEAPAEAGGAVRLMSVHKAKGLEFPVVVIADAARGRPARGGAVLLSDELGLVPAPRSFERKPLAYGLAKVLDGEKDAAEDLRVLYVAATRAQEKLLISGHQTQRGGDSWLTTLANAAGLDLRAVAAEEPGRDVRDLPGSEETIAVLVEGVRGGEEATRVQASAAGQEVETPGSPLYEPLPVKTSVPDDEEEDRTFRIRRITGRHRRTDGTIVGKMVHEALRRWRFPGDPALELLLSASAYGAGLVEAADVAEHVGHAKLLLERLRRDSRWPTLDAAARYHELPYSLNLGGGPSTGAVDLLYLEEGGAWRVVDFKTDAASTEADLQKLVQKYGGQMARYREAVSRLLRAPVATSICFLDYKGGILWEALEVVDTGTLLR